MEYLRTLSLLPHRGSTTPLEHETAQDLQRMLTGLGYKSEVTRFGAPSRTLYSGPPLVLAGFVMATWWLKPLWPWLGLVVMILLIAPLMGELLGSRLDFDLILPKARSHNVLARPVAGAGHRPTLVVTAHYDTQTGSWLFSPTIRPFVQTIFTAAYAGLGILFLDTLTTSIGRSFGFLEWFATPVSWGLLILAAFLFMAGVFGRPVNGANDNGSGVAVALSLAENLASEPLLHSDVWFLFTGSEEVGTRGMKAFMKEFRPHLDKGRTAFVNLDNIGGGDLRYLLGEGMLTYTHYDGDLIDICREVSREHFDGSVTAWKNLLLPTDGLIPAREGFCALTFIGIGKDGSIPNYHWFTDTLENVDAKIVERAEAFVKTYVRTLDSTWAKE